MSTFCRTCGRRSGSMCVATAHASTSTARNSRRSSSTTSSPEGAYRKGGALDQLRHRRVFPEPDRDASLRRVRPAWAAGALILKPAIARRRTDMMRLRGTLVVLHGRRHCPVRGRPRAYTQTVSLQAEVLTELFSTEERRWTGLPRRCPRISTAFDRQTDDRRSASGPSISRS